MTDINKHLPLLLKLLNKRLQPLYQAGQLRLEDGQKAEIVQAVRQLLPDSYGVSQGRVIGDAGQASQPLDLVIYDHTIAATPPAGQDFGISQVLLGALFDLRLDLARFQRTFEAIASLKVLRLAQTTPPVNGKGIAKQLFPLGLLYAGEIDLSADLNIEQVCAGLYGQMLKQPTALRLDVIKLVKPGITYRHPLMDGQLLSGYEIGFYREPALARLRPCYVCKQEFRRRHFFYDKLCRPCGDLNYLKRGQSADLSGRVALVTGARLRIGYATALRLLRTGATVIATSRFPHDAARRYASEPDFREWQDRLHIYGLDLRHLPGLEEFVRFLYRAYPKLDILINNAAQTVRRPPAYYTHLLPFEELPLAALPAELQPLLGQTAPPTNGTALGLSLPTPTGSSAALSQLPLLDGDEQADQNLFPAGRYDRLGQQLDLRPQNSWTLKLEEVAMPEILEVQMINAVAPAVLVGQLKGLMERAAGPKFIINVAAVEGQFANAKRGLHPHTNMAKAALNMLTYSSAADYAASQIFMNSVDPGWVSEQDPLSDENPPQLPLDETDAAARLCDPIFTTLADQPPQWGKLFKDYREAAW